jgi:hypothetical protein
MLEFYFKVLLNMLEFYFKVLLNILEYVNFFCFFNIRHALYILELLLQICFWCMLLFFRHYASHG